MRYSIFGILVQHAADVLQLSSLAIHMDYFLMFHCIQFKHHKRGVSKN